MTRPAMTSAGALTEANAIEAAHSILGSAAQETSVFSDAVVKSVIRVVKDKRAVLRGTLQGRDVVLRIYLASPEDCKRDWSELQRIWPLMHSGPHQVGEPIACAPDAGVLAVADIAGTPLLEWIYAADVPHKARYLKDAALWLRSYMDSSETEAPAAPDAWAKRAARAAKAQEFNRLRKLERPVLQEINRLVPLIQGSTWRHAIGHGDYHPNNLIVDGPRMTGIDCGGSRPAPIYKDMARFLMHMGRRQVIPSGERFLGVDKHGFDHFAEVFSLSERDRTLTLPFFIAVEALLRAETRTLSEGRIRRARKMTEALLEDLHSIGR